DVAATAFVNISTKTSKKDITYVTDEEKGTILEKLEAVGVAEYHYNHEDDDAPMRLGLIAEEAPTEVLSVSGKGVDIYKLVTFTLAGVQELAEKVGDLEVRLATVEAQLAAGVSGSGSSVVSLRGVIDGLSTLGTKVVDGVLTVTEFIADSISTKSLYVKDDFVIGSAEKPIGLTIYDKNGQIGCLEADDVVAGTISLKPGACSNDSSITTPEQTTSTTTTSTDTESPVIIINGNNPANINIGDAYSDLGAVVTDNVNDNLGITTYLDGTLVSQITLNTASSTTYTISYVAVDQAGNTATSTRQVIVSDPAETTASTATSTPQ
ncbi:MAG: DUF5011 domain-containing protein, partial [Parcubacteria group bacterium]|nr:DUF5011 domain-containing protein [Parcubacteria group bacterium]